MNKKVILTGLRANNDLHLGNYLGALLPMVDMAKQHAGEYQINLFMPDLHSFTTPIDHSKLQNSIMTALRVFVAAGLPLDNENIHIYRQSYVPAHSELTIIINNFTNIGQLSRMTQFREKSGRKLGAQYQIPDMRLIKRKFESQNITTEELYANLQLFEKAFNASNEFRIHQNMAMNTSTVGLFDYPVLMAADILIYGSSYIPVGDDQTQHLEFTRDIAERMNSKFGEELFTIPKPVKEQHKFFGKDQGLRIKDLADPIKKMSKSDETGKGVIFLTDTAEVARKKIMSAETDDKANVVRDYENQPGISNLMDILDLLGGDSSAFEGNDRYGEFKKAVADKVVEFLEDFQTKLAAVDEQALLAKLESSEAEMNKQANETLRRVQKAVGLRA